MGATTARKDPCRPRIEDVNFGRLLRIQRRPPVAAIEAPGTHSCRFSSNFSANPSNVLRTYSSLARSGTAWPAAAAYMCRAVGLSGLYLTQSAYTPPFLGLARAIEDRAEFLVGEVMVGLRLMAVLRQSTASWRLRRRRRHMPIEPALPQVRRQFRAFSYALGPPSGSPMPVNMLPRFIQACGLGGGLWSPRSNSMAGARYPGWNCSMPRKLSASGRAVDGAGSART